MGGYYGIGEHWFGTGTLSSKPGLLQTENAKVISHYCFYGAGFVASFAAIGNIVEIEHGFHMYLEEFGPVWKFVGTKILVSLAYFQLVLLSLLPPFCLWSITRQNLAYASLMCLECFLISILHLWAWSPKESWYAFQEGSNVEDDDDASGFNIRSLQAVGKNHPPRRSELQALTSPGAASMDSDSDSVGPGVPRRGPDTRIAA